MTKKFISTPETINGKKIEREFLIPDVFENRDKFVGIESKKTFDTGVVVFTGVDLDEDEVLQRLQVYHSIDSSQKDTYKDTFRKYLTQIKEIKVGCIVEFAEDFKLIEKGLYLSSSKFGD